MAELTSDEKQHIYLEEKARLEAQDRVRQEQAAATAQAAQRTAAAEKERTSNRRLGCGVMLAVLVGLLVLFVGGLPRAPTTSVPTGQSAQAWTPAQVSAAKQFWNSTIPTLEKAGLVTNYKGEGSLQVIYVNRAHWAVMPFEAKRQFLKNVSTSNEILGRTPYVEIRDFNSGKVYGALKPPLTFDIYE